MTPGGGGLTQGKANGLSSPWGTDFMVKNLVSIFSQERRDETGPGDGCPWAGFSHSPLGPTVGGTCGSAWTMNYLRGGMCLSPAGQ